MNDHSIDMNEALIMVEEYIHSYRAYVY